MFLIIKISLDNVVIIVSFYIENFRKNKKKGEFDMIRLRMDF